MLEIVELTINKRSDLNEEFIKTTLKKIEEIQTYKDLEDYLSKKYSHDLAESVI